MCQSNYVRHSILIIALLILSACNYNFPRSSPAASPSNQIDQTLEGTPQVRFTQATPTPVPTNTASPQIAADRAFENGEPLAARVNDQPIFLESFEKQVAQFERVLQAQGVDTSGSQGQTALAPIKQQVLDSLVEQLVIEQQAAGLGVNITAEEVEAKAQAAIDAQPQFEAWLNRNHLTYQEFVDRLRSQLIAGRVFEQVTQNAPESAGQIKLAHIRVTEPETAAAIIEQLKNGGSTFAILAQEHSADEPGSVWMPRGAGLLPGPVEEIGFSLNVGEVSGPIQTPRGFYIIQLEDKAPDRPLTEDMLQLVKKQIFINWLAEQRSQAVIEIFVEL